MPVELLPYWLHARYIEYYTLIDTGKLAPKVHKAIQGENTSELSQQNASYTNTEYHYPAPERQ